MQTVTLTDEQQSAADRAIRSVKNGNPLFRIGGYAGTGKTTIANYIVKNLAGHTDVCAFTGKAASVLRRKGLQGQTIHRTIYDFCPERKRFFRRPFLNGRQVLVDEGSMVATDLWRDLQSYSRPIIVIGDPGQLEPVGDDPRLMVNPDVVLEKIHRQAAESPIIEFAHKVRHGAPFRKGTKGCVSILDKGDVTRDLNWAGQWLCGFNKTRIGLNRKIRDTRGHDGLLCEGERIICLKNDRELAVFNGQMFTVTKVRQRSADKVLIDMVDDDNNPREHVWTWAGHFHSETKFTGDELQRLRGYMIADYGYCTTVHKFQGSEESKVSVIDEQCSLWCPKRHRYTAITRASEFLRYYI